MLPDQYNPNLGGKTAKLYASLTSELASPRPLDDLMLSIGVGGDTATTIDTEAARILGELYAALMHSKALVTDLHGPMRVLRMAIGLIAGNEPESQILAPCSDEEREGIRSLALHLIDVSEYRQRVEVALAQFNATIESVGDLERRIQNAALSVQTVGVEAFRELNIKNIRGMMHPLSVLHIAFEGDEWLSRLVPAPHRNQTTPLSPLPELSGRPKSTTANLPPAPGSRSLARLVRRAIREVLRALGPPTTPPPSA